MVALPDSITQPTLAAIEAAVIAAETRRFQNRISGGQIGKPCERAIWYAHRWAHEPERFDGRMLRLFGTGHVEEARMIAWLRMAGVDVADVDPATGEQWEVTALDGHFVGKLDGIATGILDAPSTPHLLECKTHNARSFAQLRKAGVAVAKPEHVAQMQVYMHLAGLTRAFYFAKCKDTDELYAERLHYDATHALALMAKAERIRDAARPPAKISDDPDSFACRFCASHAVCHGGQFALRNCRTCLSSTPVGGGNARWWCERHDRELSLDDQRAGCGQHLYVPELVAGEQIDADEEGEWVSYTLRDGALWIDGRAAA